MIVIVDDKIVFTLKRATAHGYRHYELSMDAMYHPFGFFIPFVKTGNEMLDIFQGDVFDARSVAELFAGVLITSKGKIYWCARTHEHYARRRHIWGPGTVEVFHESSDLSQAMGMALHLTGRNIPQALELMGKVVNGNWCGYITVSIPEIVEELKRRGYEQEPASLQPWTPVKPGDDNLAGP